MKKILVCIIFTCVLLGCEQPTGKNTPPSVTDIFVDTTWKYSFYSTEYRFSFKTNSVFIGEFKDGNESKTVSGSYTCLVDSKVQIVGNIPDPFDTSKTLEVNEITPYELSGNTLKIKLQANSKIYYIASGIYNSTEQTITLTKMTQTDIDAEQEELAEIKPQVIDKKKDFYDSGKVIATLTLTGKRDSFSGKITNTVNYAYLQNKSDLNLLSFLKTIEADSVSYFLGFSTGNNSSYTYLSSFNTIQFKFPDGKYLYFDEESYSSKKTPDGIYTYTSVSLANLATLKKLRQQTQPIQVRVSTQSKGYIDFSLPIEFVEYLLEI